MDPWVGAVGRVVGIPAESVAARLDWSLLDRLSWRLESLAWSHPLLPFCEDVELELVYTDKKENQIFLIYRMK
jgi:hypothetical protein